MFFYEIWELDWVPKKISNQCNTFAPFLCNNSRRHDKKILLNERHMNKRLVEKFFVNQTTPEETERVLDWFETPEGTKYLQERLDIDYELMDRDELREMVPELKSEDLYQSIQDKIGPKPKKVLIHKRDWMGYAMKVAAAVLVMLTSTFFYLSTYEDPAQQLVEREPVHFQTSSDENREITLMDGSVVRLNKNSEIIISNDFMRGTREVELTGEAFFDVVHNPEQPFIIHANQSRIRVLGTSFNVKTLHKKQNVQVAVVDGMVSLSSEGRGTDEKSVSVVLSKGQFAYMNLNERRVQVDNLAVENYIAWKSGRFVFEDLNLQQVCTQLNRIYDIQCEYANDQIKNLSLTAKFSNESLEKTLSVIALSLDLEFETSANTVTWRPS